MKEGLKKVTSIAFTTLAVPAMAFMAWGAAQSVGSLTETNTLKTSVLASCEGHTCTSSDQCGSCKCNTYEAQCLC